MSHDARENLAFMNSVDAALHNTGHPMAYVVSLGVALFFAAFIIWASLANLDEVTRGQGSVVPSQRVQVIQNLEGGILENIPVQEGWIVEKGEILAVIDNTGLLGTVGDMRVKVLEHRAAIARLEAEATGREPVFPPDLLEAAPVIVEQAQALYLSRKNQFDQEESALLSVLEQRMHDVQELESKRKTISESLNIAVQRRDNAKPLMERKIFSQQDYLLLEQQVTDLTGELNNIAVAIPRAQSARREANDRLEHRQAEIRSQALTELTKTRAELATMEATLEGREDVLRRTDVRSPVRGIVKKIHITTNGGVIKPAEPIMEIVPLDDQLLVEAKIRPSDIAFIKVGQQAMVKISTFDFSRFGGLEARVVHVGADTLEDKNGESYYQVRLQTDKNAIVYQGVEHPISPGMIATVDILTNKKTVLDYLLKPIFKAKEDAFTER
ncbi:MAG: HlyD family type I secretion periplasmic adaptor subunit [Desulfovibrionaceae bacterium]|nr:HlyD family type I secretion periplasmic adaptor subunit [Desulfovibrionaceae bacterium]